MLLALPLSFLVATASAEDAEEAVREAFSAYRSALLAGNGERAAGLLSGSTHDYYDEMRALALYGDADAVKGQSLVNQMQVLLLRLRVAPDQLESSSPGAIIALAVDQGWIGKSSVLELQPGKVLSEGDVAVLHVLVEGRDAGPAFRFQREAGAWHLDLLPTLQASNAALQMAARKQGVPEDEFALVLMESVLGRKIGAEAWVPPRSRAEP